MSGVLQAVLVVLCLCVLGVVGWHLSGGSNRAAHNSARCLDPRQPGCASGDAHPASGLAKLSGEGWKRTGAPRPPRAPAGGQSFSVPQAAPLRVELPAEGGAASGGSGEPLRAALQDLLRELPPDLRQRHGHGAPGDPSASIVEYLDGGGEVLLRVVSGRGGIFVTDYDRGLRYELDRDGSIRREGALLLPAEAPGRRAQRLRARWGAARPEALALARDPAAAASFIDLRRAGFRPDAAARWAREAGRPLPPFSTWRREQAGELGGLDEGVLRAFHTFLDDVPFLSRLAAAALGEPLLQVARRFGFQGHLLRSFLEDATTDDLLLGSRLPREALPARVRPDGPPQQRTLRALVGHPQRAVLLPLCAATLEEALERPEEVLRKAGLPAGYPYLLLREQDGERLRPLLVSVATLRSWAKPVQPTDREALERLAALPVDAPVALEAPLSTDALAALGLAREGRASGGAARLRAFALAGPLRKRLAEERAPLQRLQQLLSGPGERPPASYFGHAPFLWSSVRDGEQRLGRHGIPTGALLQLQTEQAGLGALAATFPERAPARLTGALEGLLTAYQRASKSFARLRRPLLLGAAGRDAAERWDLLEMQLAFVGLAADCHSGGRCPLPALRRPADGELLLLSLRRATAALRPRVLATTLPRADAAELADRLGELRLAADRVAAALEPERRFRPAARDAEALARMAAYVEAATGEAPRPDPAYEGGYLVRDLDSAAFRDRLAVWERGARPGPEIDGEVLRLRRDRGEVPGTLGELVQRYGAALAVAQPEHLPPGQAQARPGRRIRQRLWAGLEHLSIVQSLDGAGTLVDVEVLSERPGGALDGLSYDGDGRLVIGPDPGPVAPGGSACLRCHRNRQGAPLLALPAAWRPGAGGITWLRPVAAAELAKSAAARRAAELR